MKTVCAILGIARSNLQERLARPKDWSDGRRHRRTANDAHLLQDIREQIADLPSCGYRRACALVNRQRRVRQLPRVNDKRVFRVIFEPKLLLPKATKRSQSSRPHDGRVCVDESDNRWCSDGFEVPCDSGEVVTNTVVRDCCD